MWGKQFSGFLLLFLLLLPLSSWADVTLTDEEYKALRTELTQAKKEMQKTLDELEKSKADLTALQNQLQAQSAIWTGLSQSLTLQKKDQIIQDLKMFGIGFLAGNVTGGYAGFKIGVNIKY